MINAGADVNKLDADGISPLYMAALKGHVAMVGLLLDSGAYGADFNQEILLIVEGKGHTKVAELLVQEGGVHDTDQWMGLTAEASKTHQEQKMEEQLSRLQVWCQQISQKPESGQKEHV